MPEKKPMRKRVWFHLSSGRVIKSRVRELSVTTESGTGRIGSFKWDGMPIRTGWFWRRRILYINPTEIIAVEVRGG